MNLAEIYQDVVLDHGRRPRNFGPLPEATGSARGDNPSCGDEVEVAVRVDNGTIETARFTGQGCAICMASASLMTIRVKGKSCDEAIRMSENFRNMLTAPEPPADDESLGDLRVFEAVRKFPQRVKCATLAWHALDRALKA